MSHTASNTPTLEDPWNTNAAFWVQIIREQRDRYRNELTDPAVLAAIGEPAGAAILDAGCGEGYLARILARAGATVTGFDASARLIEAAETHELTAQLPLSFDVAIADDLPYPDDTFDVVVCNHLMNDLPDPAQAIAEFARVLRRSGRLIIMMLHPCFYNKHAEREQPTNGIIASSYFETRSIKQHFEVGGLTSPVTNTAWFRPLEYYTEELRKASFAITSITEPHPSPEQVEADGWWRKGFTRPLFLLLAAQLWEQ